MGKIFKALEKAEKKEISKRGKYTAANAKMTDSPVSGNLEKQRPVALSSTNRVPADPVPNAAEANVQARDKEIEPVKIKPDVPASPSPAEGGASAQTVPASRSQFDSAWRSRDEHTRLNEKTLPASEQAPHPHRPIVEQTDTTNLELIRAASEVTARQEQVPERRPPAESQVVLENRFEEDRKRQHVNVRYSKTRVQFNDPEKLKSNRILSIFDDVDTANQFKILRTQVLRKLKAIGGNSILVTSANQYEGKTFTSINLGLSVAKEFDRTVLIIDADIRRPTRHHTDFSTEFFSLKVEQGLTDYLTGDADIEDILINPGIDKITLIPGGVPVDNSPELLNSPRMEKMMAEIKSRYPSDRLVIVDGPALLPYPDALILYRYVDGVLPVVESEKTSAEDLRKVMKHLKDVNLLGVVLNKNKG